MVNFLLEKGADPNVIGESPICKGLYLIHSSFNSCAYHDLQVLTTVMASVLLMMLGT